MNESIILGVETSCDETSIAVVVNGKKIKSCVVSSQINFHKKYGGVVPEVASRKHVELINLAYKESLEEASIDQKEISAIAVTQGPGLIGALMVGMVSAKAISYSLNIPLITVNHLEGHIYSVFLENDVQTPLLCLICSGGHTSLVEVNSIGQYKEIGSTVDDAAGEAFDKVAKVLGFDYPGGPIIEKEAAEGDPNSIKFPLGLNKKGNYNFSFSGLKTAVIYYLRDNPKADKKNIAASFQEAVVRSLTKKTISAALDLGYKNIALAGGVAANSYLKHNLNEEAENNNMKFFYPSISLATDNAAMIAGAAYYKLINGEIDNFSAQSKADFLL